MARESVVSFELAKKVIENENLDGLTSDQVTYLAVVGAKALAYGKIQRMKRAEKVRTALAYYNAAQASGNVDAETE